MPEFDPNAWPEPRLRTCILSWLLNPHGSPSPARLRSAVEGEIVLITGASFGIGEVTARLFAAAGATGKAPVVEPVRPLLETERV